MSTETQGVHLSADARACIAHLQAVVQRIEDTCERTDAAAGTAISVAIVPHLDTLKAGLDALLEDTVAGMEGHG